MSEVVGEIYDENGILQVSMSMLGMVCRRTGTGTTVARADGNTSPSSLSVDITGCSMPVVAINIDGYVAALSSRRSNAMWFVSSAPVGVGFTYYVFDWTPALPETDALGAMWDEQGRCTFNSDFFPMQARAQFASVGQSMSTAGRAYAVAQGQMGGHSRRGEVACYDSGGPAVDDGSGLGNCRDIRYRVDGKLYGGRVSSSEGSVSMAAVSWDDVQVRAGNYAAYQRATERGWESPCAVMAVDVTNIPVPRTFF